MLDKPLQPTKATFPIKATVAGMVKFVRPVQPWKAKEPMEVTEAGRDKFFKPVQPLKALWPIEVTELGMVLFLQPLISVLDAVSTMALHRLISMRHKKIETK